MNGPIFLSISVAYYSQAQQRVETVLLGIRLVNSSEIVEKIRAIVLQVSYKR